MKKILLLCVLSTFSFAAMHFEKNQKCSECHPTIFEEYKTSQHGNSTVFKDRLHGAVYDMHPQKNKKEKYRCAICHTPTADNMEELLAVKNGVIPDPHNETQNEAIACAYCHRIEDIIPGKSMHRNKVSKEEKVYFSAKDNPASSPFHGVKTNKAVFKDGKLCMGCHTHKSNKKNFRVCSTEINGKAPEKNCITCHMHKVTGAPSVFSNAKEHTFHGFPGLHGDLTNLSQYVKITFTQEKEKFSITLDHQAPHASSLHPMRMAKLRVAVKRDDQIIHLEEKNIFNTIGTDGKPSPMATPPWLATQVIHDSRLKANSKTDFGFNYVLKKGDIVGAKFGFYMIKPTAIQKFKLDDHKDSKEFKVLSQKYFLIK